MIRFADNAEQDNWNTHILANPDGGNVLQGHEFAEQKASSGWTPRFILRDDLAITVLEKRFLGLYKLWYVPKGPGITTAQQLEAILSDLKAFARKNSVFMIKIEPELIKIDETLTDMMKLGLKKVRAIQPNVSTVTLDVSDDLETVMARLNQKGRHAIRRAERDGVTVKQVAATDENCKKMYDLLAITAAGSFTIRSYVYYKAFWQRYSQAGLGQLFFAYFEGEIVASAYAIAFGKKGTYKDGASVRERKAYGASHLLQWRVIEWMKEKGVTVHDLCGTPPSDEINNPDHPYYGMGRFKTSFNKEVTDYIGAYDLVVNPHVYGLWAKIGERIAMRIHRQLHHENYY
ncbi:MAG TPA: peptidoglycan bridge formation glycyltransferase FemA/FemB family protein [Candidatus Saccharimonadales bacterium]|nr:peptidoglycan bridge formation glycyltransferase FemA/FemB family protein [Candidatus Saccharimonadales bacterium]